MRKILTLFKREYRAAVRTKSFIISLILVPVLMGGSFVVFIIMEDNKDIKDKKIVVLDHTGQLGNVLAEKAYDRNSIDIFDPETGEQKDPAFIIELIEPDNEDIFSQKVILSDRIRSKELYSFVEIGEGIMKPGENPANDYLRYFSEHSFGDDTRYWFSNTLNNYLRQKRIEELKLPDEVTQQLFAWMNIEAMGLLTIDKKTGTQQDAKKTNELQSFLVPYIMAMLMFMLTMMSAIPLLTAVMEEKTEKIAEVLLGTVTPFQFMMGKVMGGIGISLTTASVYVTGGVISAKMTGNGELIPYSSLPWFFIFTFFYIIMVGSGMAALGATCNDNKDAQSIQFPAMLPVIIPLFIIIPVIQNPMGSLATAISFIPPFTPIMMMIRLATPVTIPLWQPIVGLMGVVLWTVFSVWAGARIFRTAILIQGQKPSVKNLFKYAFKA